MAEMCNERYTRPLELFPSDGLVPTVQCTFIKDHGANHSWFALQAQDEADLETLRRQTAVTEERGGDLPSDIQVVIDNIKYGRCDPYLEAILGATHDRKRALRGVRGFPRLDQPA